MRKHGKLKRHDVHISLYASMLITCHTILQDPNEKVVGGYILYGPKYTRFINVADVITMNGKNVGQSDKVDQVMSAGIAHSSGFLLTNMLNENGELH